MRRGVVARLRVHRQQKAERDYVQPEERAAGRAAAETGVVQGFAEDKARALMMAGHKHQQRDDREYAEHVPAD